MGPFRELLSPESGRPIFCATMSLNRFKDILRFLRFDNKNTRVARRETDKLAAFRDVWEMCLGKLQRCYMPSPDMSTSNLCHSGEGEPLDNTYRISQPNMD